MMVVGPLNAALLGATWLQELQATADIFALFLTLTSARDGLSVGANRGRVNYSAVTIAASRRSFQVKPSFIEEPHALGARLGKRNSNTCLYYLHIPLWSHLSERREGASVTHETRHGVCF
jgi:hypothetical protein